MEFLETKAGRFASRCIFVSALVWSGLAFTCMQRMDFMSMFVGLNILDDVTWLTYVVLSPAYAWSIMVLMLLSALKELLIKDKAVTLVLNGVHLVILSIISALYVAFAFDPLITLTNNISKAK